MSKSSEQAIWSLLFALFFLLLRIEAVIEAATNNDIDWIFSAEGTISAKDIAELRRYGFKVGLKISVPDTNNPSIPSLDADMFMISQDTTG